MQHLAAAACSANQDITGSITKTGGSGGCHLVGAGAVDGAYVAEAA